MARDATMARWILDEVLSGVYGAFGTTTDPGRAFGNFNTPSDDRPTLVTVEATAETDGTSAGHVEVDVDESGGTTADYSLSIVEVASDNATGTSETGTLTFYVPAGASYQVANTSDPNTNNSLDNTREVTL